jgi:two-component system, NarL family, invasion response regulator UvrY
MIRILIADDHSLIRAGLKQILTEKSNTEVIEAENGQQVFQQLKKYNIDALILDISMPGKNGLEILKEVKIQYPQIPVLILSVYPEDQYAIRSIKAGASGYLSKDAAPDQLVIAIEKVLKGGKYISAAMAEKLINDIQVPYNESKLPHELLSDREFEVLKMIGEGKTPSQIAENLFLSVKTISTYRTRILEKMKLKTSAELVHYVIKNNLLEK